MKKRDKMTKSDYVLISVLQAIAVFLFVLVLVNIFGAAQGCTKSSQGVAPPSVEEDVLDVKTNEKTIIDADDAIDSQPDVDVLDVSQKMINRRDPNIRRYPYPNGNLYTKEDLEEFEKGWEELEKRNKLYHCYEPDHPDYNPFECDDDGC